MNKSVSERMREDEEQMEYLRNYRNIVYIEVIDLSLKIQESYTKEGKELFQLIQEWIDENNSFLMQISS